MGLESGLILSRLPLAVSASAAPSVTSIYWTSLVELLQRHRHARPGTLMPVSVKPLQGSWTSRGRREPLRAIETLAKETKPPSPKLWMSSCGTLPSYTLERLAPRALSKALPPADAIVTRCQSPASEPVSICPDCMML